MTTCYCEICDDRLANTVCDRCGLDICEGCSYTTPDGNVACSKCITEEELNQ